MFRRPRADIRALERCLEAERSALMGGAHDRLATIARQKEALIARVSGVVSGADAHRLAALLERNAALLVAAADGVRAARTQLEALRVPPDTSVYQADGRRAATTPPSASLERRA